MKKIIGCFNLNVFNMKVYVNDILVVKELTP